MRKDEKHSGRDPAAMREAESREDATALPTKAAEDDPRAWGDAEENKDEWLREQRPPHWS